ncbi:MAG: ABC transporter permease [Gemmatimonadota bacterium]
MQQELRHAFRSFRKRPGFAAVATLTIALGIGANSAVFSLVKPMLFDPLPVERPSELVRPDVIAPTGFAISTSIPNFRDWREQSTSFAAFGLNMNESFTLTGSGTPEVLGTRLVLGDFFETLGVEPLLGRWIPAEATFAGAAAEAVISWGFWQRRFGGAPDVLGRVLELDGRPFTVIGVMPRSFTFPSPTTDVYLPMGFFSNQLCWDIRDCSQGSWAIARLAPGTTIGQAQADLDRIVDGIDRVEGREAARPRLEPLTASVVGDAGSRFRLLLGAVAFVLLIACANVASLLLARGEERRREVAVRTALGAGRGALFRHLLAESLALALAGGALGLGLAAIGLKLLVPLISPVLPPLFAQAIGLDRGVLAFTFLATAAAGVLTGVLPAIRGSRADVQEAMREAGRGMVGSARQRLRSGIVVAEVALSLVLLIGAGLMVRSLSNLRNVDKGFDGENVFTAEVPLPRVRYGTKEAVLRFYDELLRRVQALPGVTTASMSNIIPLGNSSWERGIWPEGVPIEQATVNSVLYHIVSPAHFDVLEIPVLQGRTFTEADRDGAPLVAIIDETMAERFWPGEDPIGKRVTFESEEAPGSHEGGARIWRTVVGVTKNVRHYELETASRIQVYVPMHQSLQGVSSSMQIMAHTSGDPLRLAAAVRREVRELDSDVPLADVSSMERHVDDAMASTRALSDMLAGFSVMAAVLAAIGLFGVLSYVVALRGREIGIRMAMGARAADVLGLVARQGLVIALLGTALGLGGAVAATRVLASALFGVTPLEPATWAAVTALLLGIAVAASLVPALRATRVDPMRVLRED